ncbi:MAG: PTS fructose transporter subunit IIA [Nitrosomonas sp.]|nr:PTS fructose transporter subunit IIA [Nitrosomonas sp.]MCW5608555.1 PTS fructose transporter subunit IIA [Nitrosomonas sp.]
MIGILVVTHENLGDHLIRCASHVVSEEPERLMHLGVFTTDDPDTVLIGMRKIVQQLDTGHGVLVLCDIFGATPCNVATRLAATDQVICITGVNLPMLVRALTYRNEALPTVAEKALSGGKSGIVVIPEVAGHAA